MKKSKREREDVERELEELAGEVGDFIKVVPQLIDASKYDSRSYLKPIIVGKLQDFHISLITDIRSGVFRLEPLRHASDLLSSLDLYSLKTRCYEFHLRTDEISKKLLALK